MTLREDQIRMIDALADDRLEGAERAEAERLVRDDQEAAAILAATRAADSSLRRLVVVPPEFEPVATTISPSKGAIAPRRAAWTRWALAAGLLLAAAGAYITNFVLITSPDSLRSDFIASGFVPSWKCKDDTELVEYSTARTGEPFLVAASDSLSVLGWDSGHGLISDETVSLWATSRGVPVVVFIDRAQNDRQPRMRPFSGMHLFRGRLGEVVFYEVSPMERPVVLPLIHRPGESPGLVEDDSCEGPAFSARQFPSSDNKASADPDGP